MLGQQPWRCGDSRPRLSAVRITAIVIAAAAAENTPADSAAPAPRWKAGSGYSEFPSEQFPDQLNLSQCRARFVRSAR